MNMRCRRNVALFFLYQVFSKAAFHRGIFILFLLGRGVSPIEAGILQAVLYWTQFAAEIPTGIFGDRYGRRVSVLIGLLISAAVAGLQPGAHGFSAFLVLFMLQGTAFACVSGSDQALLYDSLRAVGKEADYLPIQAKLRAVGSITLGVSIALGGVLKEVSWVAVYFSVACALFLGAATVFMMIEAPTSAAGERRQEEAEGISHDAGIVSALASFLRERKGRALIPLLLASGLLHATITPYFVFSQRVFDWYRMDAKIIALIFALVEVSSGFMGLLAEKASRLLPFEKMFYAVFTLMALLLALNWVENGVLAVALFFLIILGPEILINVADAYYQDRIPSRLRASLLSTASFVESLLTGVAYFACGLLVDRLSPNRAMSLTGVIPLVGLFFAVWYFRHCRTDAEAA